MQAWKIQQPSEFSKVMERDHRNNAGRIELVQLIHVSLQLGLIQRSLRFGLQPRPLNAHPIGIDSQLTHPLDALAALVIAVAGDVACVPVAGDEISPLVVDVTFDLRGGGRGSPKKRVGKFQQLPVLRRLRRSAIVIRLQLDGVHRWKATAACRHKILKPTARFKLLDHRHFGVVQQRAADGQRIGQRHEFLDLPPQFARNLC